MTNDEIYWLNRINLNLKPSSGECTWGDMVTFCSLLDTDYVSCSVSGEDIQLTEKGKDLIDKYNLKGCIE
ncbi:hypothetical protein C4577_01830 [Candidatus Parcubacteria bacterium]|nr:MAG: hypothetical protein C4577_01830 [Candidatus Parcubacteria bacterium]